MRVALTTAALGILTATAWAQPVIYVDIDATGADDGTSWSDAYTGLQDAIDDAIADASSTVDIWVAEGTYVRHGGASREGFVIAAGPTRTMRIYGGFAGTESSLSQRAGLFESTILSGDLGTANDSSDNAYHVLEISLYNSGMAWGSGATTVLDGFVVTLGNADGSTADRHGAGVYAGGKLYARNCTIEENSADGDGAGILSAVVTSRVEIVDSVIRNNTAGGGGAGMRLNSANVYVASCDVEENSADGNGGGIWLKALSNSIVADTNVRACSAGSNGGGIYIDQCQFSGGSGGCNPCLRQDKTLEVKIVSCTIADNLAGGEGGGIFQTDPSCAGYGPAGVLLGNSILWGNEATTDDQIGGISPTVVAYCDIEGGWSGTAVINTNPRFVSTSDLRLVPASPARDVGSQLILEEDPYDHDLDGDYSETAIEDQGDLDLDSNVTEPLPLDRYGNLRLIGSTIDLGAHESCVADIDLDGDVDGDDYSAFLAAYAADDSDYADIDRDGDVDSQDVIAWLNAYTDGCD